jgi:hypothetical protein
VTIGLSTYSVFWQWHETAPRPISLVEMIDKTAGWDVHVLQICDYHALDGFDSDAVRQLGAAAERAQVTLELGARGLDHPHLTRYLSLAQRLGARLVRSMIRAEGSSRSRRYAAPDHSGVRAGGGEPGLGETYEQVPTARLMEVVRRINSPSLGVCLDPANCVAALERPGRRSSRRGSRVQPACQRLRLHPEGGWVGFTYAGTRLGKGCWTSPMASRAPDATGCNRSQPRDQFGAT